MLRKLFNLNPLWLIALAFVGQVLVAPASVSPGTIGLVLCLAYIQNAAYGLQSRSANRNSNAYHLIAAVAANLVFFVNLRLLVTKDMPLVLLAPYVFATIVGTLHGNTISMKIESALGLSAEGAKGRPQLLKLWPTVAVLFVALVGQAIFLAPTYGRGILVALLLLTVMGSFAFSLLRVARSTDHYWFHLVAVALNLGVGFLSYMIMINNKYDWGLFLPTTTGSIIGSLVGASVAQDVGKKIKAAFDAHVSGTTKITFPSVQLGLLGVVLLVHAMIFGVAHARTGVVLLALSMWQAVSFTMVSRARQRNNAQYLAWTSVFSNGVWYLTMHALTKGAIGWDKAAPYIVGNSAGSLVGQNLAMQTEKATGALMDEPSAPKPAVA